MKKVLLLTFLGLGSASLAVAKEAAPERKPGDAFCSRTDLAALDVYKRGLVKAHCPGVSITGAREELLSDLFVRAGRQEGASLASYPWGQLKPEDLSAISEAESWASDEGSIEARMPIYAAVSLYLEHKITAPQDFVRLALTGFPCTGEGLSESLASVLVQAISQDTKTMLEIVAKAQKTLQSANPEGRCLQESKKNKIKYVDEIASALSVDASPEELEALKKKLGSPEFKSLPMTAAVREAVGRVKKSDGEE